MATITYVQCDNCGKKGQQRDGGRYPEGWARVEVVWKQLLLRDVCDDCLVRIGDIFKEPV